ncbi:MAG: acylphosphatase [Atribacterota bacterium]
MDGVRGRLVFHGRVQGVGFRYYVIHAASHHEVTGYVKNTCDGAVEVVAEGQKEEVRNFFLDIQEGPVSASIRSVVEEWSPYTGFYPTFQVEYE